MPQLMPFYWVNSVFMILFVIVTLAFFYFYKNVEGFSDLNFKSSSMIMFGFKW